MTLIILGKHNIDIEILCFKKTSKKNIQQNGNTAKPRVRSPLKGIPSG
jgi:hypothetical protein